LFPIHDPVKPRSFPFVSWILIGLTTLVFLYESSLQPAELQLFINQYGLTPANLNLSDPSLLNKNISSVATGFTRLFVHSGWFHFLSNAWMLRVFGGNVEDRIGCVGFLAFYLLGGAAAAFLQLLFYPSSTTPIIGASGAIAAVMGAYFLYFPTARILTLVLIVFVPWITKMPAMIFLGFWFVSQIYSGYFSLNLPAGSGVPGVAWWAHIGGFLFGFTFARLFETRYRVLKHKAKTSDDWSM
jgi:membrane associated rhomboid family serine protease